MHGLLVIYGIHVKSILFSFLALTLYPLLRFAPGYLTLVYPLLRFAPGYISLAVELARHRLGMSPAACPHAACGAPDLLRTATVQVYSTGIACVRACVRAYEHAHLPSAPKKPVPMREYVQKR
jgi:hypothetical protein